MRHVVVIGAGLGGLAAAVRLAAAGRDVTIVEADQVPGGCCGTAALGDYRFDPLTGLWHHRTGAVEPPMRLAHVSYADDGTMTWPAHATTAPVSVLREHLDEGRAIMAAASPPDWSDAAHLGPDFDDLRWFALPAVSLGG